MTRLAARITVLAVLATLGGCATSATTVVADTAPARGLGAVSPASGTVEAADLLPGHEGTERWRAVEGLLAPGEFDVSTVAEAGNGSRSATKTADLETATWSRAADGSLVLEQVDSHPDKARSIFTPPLLLAPPSLAADADEAVESAMRVVSLPAGTAERDKGKGRRTVRYGRDETIEWRGQPTQAKVVEVHFVATLGSAKADRRSELFVVPGEGIVAERWSETLTILKVFEKKSSQTAVREGAAVATRRSAR